ncbi:hypothetical protein GCG54_00014614 [Colletotrichum gloeosporioides]|uniref:Uncharacterized protein n=1 Tax=Colletotrichum gloeosporioides TaxID=474922 RepID=A0A8H4C5S1_COLGL|nr:uncharacterized protein GCG54_00014614 [Colletotrichum gloeosporioides]KAF3797716.1 hypothetical protein GCG54_00014614 [Colletotrichum gloeosporioides]
MTVTEVGCMGVKPGLSPMDDSTPEGSFLSGAYRAVTVAEGGPYRAFWGTEIENPLLLWGFFDFDSVEHHEVFAKLHGAEIVKDLPALLTHGEFVKHLSFTPSSSVALQCPVTELVLVHFPGDVSAEVRAEATISVRQILTDNFQTCVEVTAVSWGWSVENDFPIRGQSGNTGAVLAALIGWGSADGQRVFYQTEIGERARLGMNSIQGAITVTRVSVRFRYSGRK